MKHTLTLGIALAVMVNAMAQPAPTASGVFAALQAAAQKAQPMMPAAGKSFSKQEKDVADATLAAAHRAVAAQARQFQERFPDDDKRPEAAKLEISALFGAARSGDPAAEAQALTLADNFTRDARNPRSARYAVASAVHVWRVEKQKLKDRSAEFAALERAGGELQREFPEEPEAYHFLLGLARNAPTPQKARSLASDLLSKPAPTHVKTEAQSVLGRLDLPGKSIPLRFELTNGTHFDLRNEQGRAVVVYFWANNVSATAAAMPLLRAAAADTRLRFVGVNLDAGPMALVKAPDGQPPPGEQHWEPLSVGGRVPRELHVNRVPSVYVFDAQGVLHGFGHPRELADLLRGLERKSHQN